MYPPWTRRKKVIFIPDIGSLGPRKLYKENVSFIYQFTVHVWITNHGPLEEGGANHFSILALRIPRAV